MGSRRNVTFLINANTRGFVRGLGRAQKNFRKFGRSLKRAGSSMSRNVTLPLALLGGAAIKLAADFETSMTKIQTLVGLSADKVGMMTGSVINLSNQTGRSSKELADALFVVTSAGQRGAAAMQILERSAKASAIGLGETKVIARATTAILNAYGEENISAAKATDQLMAVVREGNLEASDLAPTLGRVIGVASQLGISFAEVGASIATFTRLGVQSEEAVTGLRGLMNSLIKVTPAAREAFKKLGTSIDEVRVKVGKQGLAQTMVDLVQANQGNLDSLGKLIPNVRALSAVLGTAGAQGEEYLRIAKSIEGANELVNEGFKTAAETTAVQFRVALEGVKNVGIELGTIMLPMVKDMLDAIKSGATAFSNLSTESKRFILIVGGFAAAAGPLALMLGTIFTLLGALTGPIALVVAGLTALVAITAALTIKSKGAADNLAKERDGLNRLVTAITNTNDNQRKRNILIQELQKKYPGFIANIDAENVSNGYLLHNLKKINKEYGKRIERKIFAEDLENLTRKKVELNRKIRDLTLTLSRQEDQLTITGLVAAEDTKVYKDLEKQITQADVALVENAKALLKLRIEAGLLGISLVDAGDDIVDFAQKTDDAGGDVDDVAAKVKNLASGLKELSAARSKKGFFTPFEEGAVFAPTKGGLGDAQGAIERRMDVSREAQKDFMKNTIASWANWQKRLKQIWGQTGSNLKFSFDNLKSILDEGFNITQGIANALTAVFVSIGESIGQMFAGVEDSFSTPLQRVLLIVADFAKSLGGLLIAIGTLMVVTGILAGPGGLIIGAGVGLVALGSFASASINKNIAEKEESSRNAVPRFAHGGMVPAGFPNDTYPAMLSSNEMVIPSPDALPNMGGDFVLSHKFAMRDFIIEMRREEKRMGRS